MTWCTAVGGTRRRHFGTVASGYAGLRQGLFCALSSQHDSSIWQRDTPAFYCLRLWTGHCSTPSCAFSHLRHASPHRPNAPPKRTAPMHRPNVPLLRRFWLAAAGSTLFLLPLVCFLLLSSCPFPCFSSCLPLSLPSSRLSLLPFLLPFLLCLLPRCVCWSSCWGLALAA